MTKLRFPDMVHVGDITKLNGAELPPVELVCGGSPCQDYAEETVIPKWWQKAVWCEDFLIKTSE